MKGKKEMNKYKWTITGILLSLLFICAGCFPEQQMASPTPPPVAEGDLIVTFFDVGQGDATLFQTEEATILIDAGRHDREEVVSLLEGRGVERIDLFIATHPHADHIGQADQVLDAFPVEEVWMSGDSHTTKTFERMVEALEASGADYYEPRAGEEFEVGPLLLEVLHPEELTGDLNNGSIAVKLHFGEVSFLMMGDAEAEAEEEIIARSAHLQSTILRLGHHGSSTSTTPAFLEAVNPEAGIYSAGRDNEYGHPHSEVVELFKEKAIPLFGTDQHGQIIVETDGTSYEIILEHGE
ncbi:MBL fold metallo-hydrolase [Alkalihalobacillus oceani]|uniref:ComEC/Rec2 family competence protein n=1 Tax=Halalkalibacter oceani TaxID=1653776 RepID=UPI00203DAE8E|nr:MBL fold metallo-hydrolase [Halalkalibacter oceani]